MIPKQEKNKCRKKPILKNPILENSILTNTMFKIQLLIQEKRRVVEKLKFGESETDIFAAEVVQELKLQLGKEQAKLEQVRVD